MIREALRFLATPCPWHLRRLQYEQIAIDARLRRIGSAWEPHQRACRQAVIAAMGSCRRRGRAVVLGGGLVHDVPLRELVAGFREVVLADAVFPLGARRRHAPATLLRWDATGALARWHRDPPTAERLIREMGEARPDPLPDADLVVSVNLASQLGRVPAGWSRLEADAADRVRDAATAMHVRWLRAQPASVLVIGELAHVARSMDGTASDRAALAWPADMPPPLATWTWRMCPIPEWSPDHHLDAEVAAWGWVGGAG